MKGAIFMKRLLLAVILLLFLPAASYSESVNLPAVYDQEGRQEYIRSLAWAGDQLYLYAGSRQLYRLEGSSAVPLSLSFEQHPPMPEVGPSLPSSSYVQQYYQGFDHLLSDGEKLWGLNFNLSGALYALSVEEHQASARLAVMLDWADVIPDVSGVHRPARRGTVMMEDTLYVAYAHEEEDARLCAFSLDDGSRDDLPVEHLRSVTQGADGQLICVTEPQKGQYRLELLDVELGTITKTLGMLPSEAALGTLSFDASTGTFYLATLDGVLASTDGSQWEHAFTMPFRFTDGNPMAILPGKRLAAAETGVYLRSLTDTPTSTAPLTICGWEQDDIQRSVFIRNPDQPINYLVCNTSVNERFIKDMINRESAVDIYELELGPSFTRFVQKGYFVPLTSDSLLPYQDALYDAWRGLLMDSSGQLAALPKQVEQYGWGVSQDALLSMGIEVPDGAMDYDAFLDLVLQCAGQCDEYDLYLIHGSWVSLPDELAADLIRRFVCVYQQKPTQALSMENALVDLLERIRNARGTLPRDAHRRWQSDSYGHSATPSTDYIMTAMHSYVPGKQLFTNGLYGLYMKHYTPLRPSVTSATEALIPARATVFVINPYSSRQVAAMAYLAEYYSLMDETRAAAFFTGHSKVENKFWADKHYLLSDEREEIMCRIQESSEDTKSLQAKLDAIQAQITALEPLHWQVTPDITAQYEQALSAMVFMEDSSVMEAVNEAIQDYCRGTADIRGIVKKLCHTLRLIELEE